MKATVVLILLVASGGVIADEEMKFVESLCVHSTSKTTIPAAEQTKFCGCVVEDVRAKITAQQRASIREVQSYVNKNQAPPRAAIEKIEKSRLNALVSESQDRCADKLWPLKPEISQADHERYSSLANKSVNEFEALTDRCTDDPGPKRDACLEAASREWLSKHAAPYTDIPETYVTGNDLARELLKKLGVTP